MNVVSVWVHLSLSLALGLGIFHPLTHSSLPPFLPPSPSRLFHLQGGDTEMKETEESAVPERVPLMVVNNENGSKTVLRSTRKTAKASSIIAPAEDAAPR